MRRREFIKLIGGAAAGWPRAALAQQTATPVIGYLQSGIAHLSERQVAAFRKGLSDAGYVEGRNVRIEYRFAEGQQERLPAMAAELVRHRVALIVAVGGAHPALAAKAASTTIPIVFASGDTDPIQAGLVVSFSRPGGNLTGVSGLFGNLAAKRIGLLHELIPTASAIGMLANPNTVSVATQIAEAQRRPRLKGLTWRCFTQALIETSNWHLAQWQSAVSMRFSSRLMLFTGVIASKSLLWRSDMQFQQATIAASSSKREG